MSKHVLTILTTLMVVAAVGLAAMWLLGPMALGPALYGMGPWIMAGGWGGFTWFGLLFGLIRLLFWLAPITLLAVLLSWLLRSGSPKQKG